jgi:hypothetical protein
VPTSLRNQVEDAEPLTDSKARALIPSSRTARRNTPRRTNPPRPRGADLGTNPTSLFDDPCALCTQENDSQTGEPSAFRVFSLTNTNDNGGWVAARAARTSG